MVVVPQVTTQTTTTIAKNKGSEKPWVPVEQYALINAPDSYLKAIASNEPYEKYRKNPTRGVTKLVGNSIPYVDSYLTGALTKGSTRTKLAATGDTATDWGVFTGAIWLYNKALNKVYDTFPEAKKFRQENPTISYVGEAASAVAVGNSAIWGFNKLDVKEKAGRKIGEFLSNHPGFEKNLGKVFKPVSNIAENIPKPMKSWIGLGTTLTLVGLIAKNIFDVHHAHSQVKNNYEQLKDLRYQETKALLQNVITEHTQQA